MKKYKEKKEIHNKVRKLICLPEEEQPQIYVYNVLRDHWFGPAQIDPKFSDAGDSASGFTLCVKKTTESRNRTFYADEVDELHVEE